MGKNVKILDYTITCNRNRPTTRQNAKVGLLITQRTIRIRAPSLSFASRVPPQISQKSNHEDAVSIVRRVRPSISNDDLCQAREGEEEWGAKISNQPRDHSYMASAKLSYLFTPSPLTLSQSHNFSEYTQYGLYGTAYMGH